MTAKTSPFAYILKIGAFSLIFLLASCTSASTEPTPTTLPPTNIPPTETPSPTATTISGIDEVTEQSIDFIVDGETESYGYLLYLPENYAEQEEWPLLLYLHGGGSLGSNLSLLLREEIIMKELGSQLHIPAIVVAPQAPKGPGWDYQIPNLEAFLTAVEEEYPVDTTRIYLTGYSMGGYGTWAWGLHDPDRFAALAPVAGGYFDDPLPPENICDMKDTPIWAFTSTADTVVPASRTESLTDALEACGAEHVMVTLYDDASHYSIGERPYASTSELYDWLWGQSLDTE